MPGRRRPRLVDLPAAVRATLVRWTRSPSRAAGRARRAQIVRRAATGLAIRHIAARVGGDRTVVRTWRARFRAEGMDGLHDHPRPGLPVTPPSCAPPGRLPTCSCARCLPPTCCARWTSRPPCNRGVPGRTPTRPARPSAPLPVEHADARAGAVHRFAAFDTRTGTGYGVTVRRERQVAYLALRAHLDQAIPATITTIHRIADNVRGHHGQQVRAWLAAQPRFVPHCTPMHCAWLHQVEPRFGILPRNSGHAAAGNPAERPGGAAVRYPAAQPTPPSHLRRPCGTHQRHPPVHR